MDLTHHFLLSMPALANSWFDKTLTYIFEHSSSGAVGFVINRHTHMKSGDIYDQMNIDCDDPSQRSDLVLEGGPVDQERGFILLAKDSFSPSSSAVSEGQNSEKNHNSSRDEKSPDNSELADTDTYHSNEFGIGISSSIELLTNLGRTPDHPPHLLLLGYAGWASGQLESEIASNSWLTCKATEEIIFHEDCERKFDMAAKSIGIDFSLISGEIGHA